MSLWYMLNGFTVSYILIQAAMVENFCLNGFILCKHICIKTERIETASIDKQSTKILGKNNVQFETNK